MEFQTKIPSDYYQQHVIKQFNDADLTKVDYNSPVYLRNIPKMYKLTLDHIEMIEYYTRLIKPNHFMELGVQFGEATRKIIPHVHGMYYAVDIERSDNIDYFEREYTNFKFSKMTTDDFFADLKEKGINLGLEMAFIDACHTHEATYRDFLNVRDHLVNDGIIFMHDMYPKNLESSDHGLSGDCYKTAEKIRLEHHHEFEIITIPVEPGLSILRKVHRQLNWLPSKE